MYVGILDDIFCASEALCLVHLIISFYLFIRLDNFKFADSFFCHLRYAIESTKWIFITVTVFLNSRFSIWFLFIISIFWLIFSVQWLIVTIFSFYSLNMDSFSSLNNIYFFLFLILTRGYLLIWEREREREREREKHWCGRNIDQLPPVHSPTRGWNPQSRYVHWLGIDPIGFWCTGWPNNSTTWLELNNIYNSYFESLLRSISGPP